MAIVPITLIPQMVLGGLIVSFKDLSGFAKLLAAPILSRWAFELTLLLDGTELAGESADPLQNARCLGFNPENTAVDIVVIIVMALVFLGAVNFLIKNKAGNN